MKFNKKTILIICFVAAFLIIDSVIGVMLYAQKKVSNLKLDFVNSTRIESLISLDSNSKKAYIEESEEAVFNFTDNQRIEINKIYKANSNASLVIRVEFSLTDKQKKNYTVKNYPFEFGFIDASGKKSITITANQAEFINPNNRDKFIFDLSLAFAKNTNGSIQLPNGFYVYSSLQCKIVSACVAPSVVGFDCSTEIPFFGFSSNGGTLNTDFSKFDFTGASLIFPNQNSSQGYMPEYLVKFTQNEKCFSTLEDSVFVKMNFGSEKIKIKCVKNMKESILPTSAFVQPFSLVDVTENKVCISGILMRAFTNLHDCSFDEDKINETYIPIRTDPGLMLYWNQNNWRNVDYELFEWDRFPGILYFDTRNYTIQDNFFRRLAFFAEKEGYKGKLLTNEELGNMHGFNALDYRPETFADFFNLAYEKNFKLNKEEILLKKILIKNGLLIEDGEKVKPGYGAVVSISRESPDYLRVQLINHEAWHTLYFIDETFKSYVETVYGLIDRKSLEFLIDFFRSQPQLGYDVNDDFLMKNEFMAYLIQLRLGSVGQYFVTKANWYSVQTFTPELSNYVIQTKGQGFEDAAQALNDFVFDTYGLIAGDVTLVK